jgi:hypothetical protein
MEYSQEKLSRYMKVKKDTIYTISILLLIILIFSYLLYSDFFRKNKLTDQEIIGVVTFKERTVQRKFDISAVWDELENQIPVANRDTIRTLEFADAVLTLKDNTKIKLSDNSMIYLDFTDQNLNINMEGGNISAERENVTDPNSKVNIQSGDKIIQIGLGSTNVVKGEDENLNVKVEKGTAILNVNGKEQLIEKNQTAELKNNKIEIRPLKFQLLSPSDGKFISTQTEKINLSLEWAPIENVSDVRLEVANDRNFSINSKVYPLPRENSKTLDLVAGTYYWRVTAKNRVGGKLEFSETRKFKIVSEKTIKITNPTDGKVFQYTSKLPIIPVGWTKNEISSSYKLELSTTPDFSKIIKSNDLFQTNVSLDVPSKGTYYLRITTKPSLPDISPMTTPVVRFSVEEKDIPSPPEIISPSVGSSFSPEFFQKGKVNFAWRDVKDFSSYEVEISKFSDFSSNLVKQTVTKNFISPSFTEKPGEIYFRVRGILADGRKSDFTKAISLRISEPEKLRLLYPEDLSEIDMPSDKQINFKWLRPESSGQFVLELSSDKSFANILQQKNDLRSFTTSVPIEKEGSYYWRLRLVTRDGTELNKSDTFNFTVLSAPVPKLNNPPNESEINLTNRSDVQFDWASIPNVNSYDLEIFDSSKAAKRSIFKITTNETNLLFKEIQRLPEGRVTWSISLNYIKKDGKIGKSPPSSFSFRTVVPKIEPPVPKTITPANGSEQVMADKEELNFTWEKNEKALFYQLDIYEKSSKKPKLIYQKQTAETSHIFDIPNTIGEGEYTYELIIHYKTWDGKIIKSNPTRSDFRLKLPLRSPPLPELKKPINSEEVKPTDKWEVFLDWEANPRATSYIVSVKDARTNKQIFTETTTLNRSTFIVSDSAIKPGSYKWSVILNYKSINGKDLKSPPKFQEFVLSIPPVDIPIPVPIAPETKTGFNRLETNEIVFKWEKNDSANSFIYELYESLEENSKPILQSETKGTSYTLKDINQYKDNIYYWKIIATYKDRLNKVIKGEPIISEFTISTPQEDKTQPLEILSKPRLYVE